MKRVKILLVGTGRMAQTHAERFNALHGVQVDAAVDVDIARANAFCKRHDIAHAYTSVKQALSRHTFDAASIVTPDSWHASTSTECMQAGLAVLCEKPLSDSVLSSNQMVDTAIRTGVINMVNLSYRVSGSLHLAQQFVAAGEIGDIRHVEASYRQSWLTSPYWGDWRSEDTWLWRLSTQHGSLGVLGDIGIHILDYVTAGVGMGIQGLQCRLQTFSKAPNNRIGEYTLDANDSCVINAEFDNGALGVIHMSRYASGYMNDLCLTIHGTLGALKVSTGSKGDRLSVCVGEELHSQQWKDLDCEPQADTFERFVNAIRSGTQASPDFAHAARLQRYIEQCFNSHNSGTWLASGPDLDLFPASSLPKHSWQRVSVTRALSGPSPGSSPSVRQWRVCPVPLPCGHPAHRSIPHR